MPPPKKRGRGRPRGSVYWHAASERWCAQTPPDRRSRRRSRYFADEDAAWAWLAQQTKAIDDGAEIAAGAERFGRYLRRWLERGIADPERDWSPSTVHSYTWAVEHLEAHRTARTAVGDLSRDVVDTFLSDLGKTLARKSVGMIRSVLRSAIEDLVDDGIVNRNPVRPARRRGRGEHSRPNRCPWSEDDARKFLATARRSSERPALWWLVLSCGLRSGELRALTLADVDLDNGTLTVSKSINLHSQVGPTKSGQTRVITLPKNVAAALREHLRARRSIGGRLFQARTPGPRAKRPDGPMSGATLLKELRSLRVEAGVPPLGRVHDLRHIAGSLMLANGYPVPTVASILGHTPEMLMKVYAHAIPKHVIGAPHNIADVLPWEPPATATSTGPAVRPAVPPPVSPPAPGAQIALTSV
jgi:integrase